MALGVSIGLALAGPISAQSVPDAASIEFQRRSLQPQTRPLAEPAAPEAEPSVPQVGAGGPTFQLNAIVLDGARTLSESSLSYLWVDMIGTEVTVDSLEALAARISARYRAEGFVLSQAVLPAQRVEDGIVLIRVIEGFVDQITVDGADSGTRRFVNDRMQAVHDDRPLRIVTLERAVLLTRDTLGGSVETVLEPSDTTFGAADLTIVFEPKPFAGFATIDNRGSRLYGGWIASGGVTGYNLLGLNEEAGVIGAVAPDDVSLYYVKGYFGAPLPFMTGTSFDGTRIELEGSMTRGEPDIERSGIIGVESEQNETNLTARLFTPFRRTRTSNLFGWFSLDWRQSEIETDFFGTSLGTETDRLLVLEPRLAWDRADSLAGVSLIDVRLRQGLDIGATQIGTDGPDQPEGNFTLINVTVARLQSIPDTTWSVYAFITGQIAADILPDSERFGLGGEALGRGFAPGNTTGDSGFGGRVEIRRLVSPTEIGNVIAGAQVYGFGDWGQAYDRAKSRDGNQWETLGSVGIGARIDIVPWLTVEPELAWQVAGEPKDRTIRDRELRAFLGVTTRF